MNMNSNNTFLTIVLARARKTKNIPNVEGAAGKISAWITAAFRNEPYFSLPELNTIIKKKLEAYNVRKFPKKPEGVENYKGEVVAKVLYTLVVFHIHATARRFHALFA